MSRQVGAPWRFPFWALQIFEFGAAFLLVTQSVHVDHGGVLVASGLVLAVLALTADGPLGVFRLCDQRLHRTLVLVVAAALIAAGVVRATRPDAEGLLVMAFAVLALVFVATRTTVTAGRRARGWRFRRTSTPGPVIEASATSVPATPGPEAAPVQPPEAGSATDGDPLLRRAGRTAGTAKVVGQRLVDEHRPEVEDHARRAIRGAGRLAGRFTAPKTPSADSPVVDASSPGTEPLP